VFDLNRSEHRRAVVIVAVASAVVLAVLTTAGIKGAEFGDSSAFCGLTCHTVMKPQWDTYKASSHAKVECVRCHIGPGTSWFVKSKLSGTGQVIAYNFNTYPRPIPAPIESLRPSRDTCEQCHWPERVYGDRLRIRTSYASDQANTPVESRLMFRVGGGLSHSTGIHWHIANEVWYLPDDAERQQLSWVATKSQAGVWTEYVDPTVGKRPTQAQVDKAARRMDCIDCHNRSAHNVADYPKEVDRALAEGRIDSSLPYVKQQALTLGPSRIGQPFAENSAEVVGRIATLGDFYQRNYPAVAKDKPEQVQKAVAELTSIYQRSVFQEMRTDWTTYQNNIGHEGCFRCHGVLTAADGPKAGQAITFGCTTCHYPAEPAGRAEAAAP
jgi:nitrate/TMAO reductase-like tetraheme cytochrome c subunit